MLVSEIANFINSCAESDNILETKASSPSRVESSFFVFFEVVLASLDFSFGTSMSFSVTTAFLTKDNDDRITTERNGAECHGSVQKVEGLQG